jgi:hypothetical protein
MGVTVVAHAEATPPESRIVPLRLFVRQGNIAMLVVCVRQMADYDVRDGPA